MDGRGNGRGPRSREAGGDRQAHARAKPDVGSVRIVQDQAGLEALAAELRQAGEFGLDTEFIPEGRLFPELGLVQVASASVEAVVDPLAVADLTPIHDLIRDRSVLKIVHSGKHDFEIFHRLASVVPRNVFDTQTAAAVIGCGGKTQIALRALVAGFVGRELSKQEQMSDWLKRPLTPRQVEYAISDVRYLIELRRKLTARANALGRVEWLAEELEPLTREETYALRPPEEYYRNLDRPGLTPRQRGALRELTAWRERRARTANRPRAWILRDAVVLAVARRTPGSDRELLRPYDPPPDEAREAPGTKKTRKEARGLLATHARAVLAAVARGVARPVEHSEAAPDRRPAPESLALLLETWARVRAAELGVASEMLASREELRAIAAAPPDEPPDVRVLSGYRRRALGDDLLDIISGRAVIQVTGAEAPGGRPPVRLIRRGWTSRLFEWRRSKGQGAGPPPRESAGTARS